MNNRIHIVKRFLQPFVLLVLVLSSIEVNAQTDAQIGYNRELSKQGYLEDGGDPKRLESALFEYRNSLLEIYKQSGIGPIQAPEPSSNCGNVDFQDGFNEWQYFRGQRTDGNGTIVYTDFGNIIPENSGSEILDQNLDVDDVPGNASLAQLNLQAFGNNFIRLGANNSGAFTERITHTITVGEANRLFSYKYAVVLQNPTGHDQVNQPFFNVHLQLNDDSIISCSQYAATAGDENNFTGFLDIDGPNGSGQTFYRPVAINSIDLLDVEYGLGIGDLVTIVVEVADCFASVNLSTHYGYAFFEGRCGGIEQAILSKNDGSDFCAPNSIYFYTQQDTFGQDPSWQITDSSGSVLANTTNEGIEYLFETSGEYLIELLIDNPGLDADCEIVFRRYITITDCDCQTCENCDSFAPVPGEKYVLSAWVQETHDTQQMDFTQAYLDVGFLNGNGNTFDSLSFYASGDIIDNWQQIQAVFTIPRNTSKIDIGLVNELDGGDAFFDDIRIHPFNSNMKSFVYDQNTQRLMAELDENNYATYYEYDQEGGLIRVKKETEKGVYTIQETRSGNSTLNGN